MKIAAFIDIFINPDHFENPGRLRRARLFVRACFLTSLFSCSYIWTSMLFDFDKGVYLMIFNAAGFMLLPFAAKTRLPITFLANCYVLIGAIAVLTLTYFSGGMWSALYPWIIAIPVLAMLVVDRNSGLIWGAISLGFMIFFGVQAMQGYAFPVEYNTELKTELFVTVVPGLLPMILLIAAVFEGVQRRAMAELEKKNKVLKIQKETIGIQTMELEKHIEDKDYIIRILAHDLKNPLSNITSLTDLIKENGLAHEQKEIVDMISKSSANAQNLVNRVLEMDVSDQKSLNIQLETLDIAHHVKGVVHLMKESARKKNIEIVVENIADETVVLVDKTYLSLVFENLISNALKFSPGKSTIQIEIRNDEDHVQVQISDEGPGIMVEEEDRLFKKFAKLTAKPTAGEGSTGLGLALVKRYIEMLHGQVWYERTNTVGATFVVELPIKSLAW